MEYTVLKLTICFFHNKRGISQYETQHYILLLFLKHLSRLEGVLSVSLKKNSLHLSFFLTLSVSQTNHCTIANIGLNRTTSMHCNADK